MTSSAPDACVWLFFSGRRWAYIFTWVNVMRMYSEWECTPWVLLLGELRHETTWSGLGKDVRGLIFRGMETPVSWVNPDPFGTFLIWNRHATPSVQELTWVAGHCGYFKPLGIPDWCQTVCLVSRWDPKMSRDKTESTSEEPGWSTARAVSGCRNSTLYFVVNT